MKINKGKRQFVVLDDGTIMLLDRHIIEWSMFDHYAYTRNEMMVRQIYRHYLLVAYELHKKCFIDLLAYGSLTDENFRLYQAKMGVIRNEEESQNKACPILKFR